MQRGLLACAVIVAACATTGCAATVAFGDARASLCHTADGGTLSDNAIRAAEAAAEAAAEGAARGVVGGGLPGSDPAP